MDFNKLSELFVDHYYNLWDNPGMRDKLIDMYSPEDCFLTLQGDQVRGAAQIVNKIKTVSNNTILRDIGSVDSHPTKDDGLLINVLGFMQIDDYSPQDYSQMFLLKYNGERLYIVHDIFRFIPKTV